MNFDVRKGLATLALGIGLLIGSGTVANAQTPATDLTKQIGLDQKLGARVPTDATFRDETGKEVKIGDYLKERPMVLVPIFYRCTTACVVIGENLLKTLAKATRTDSLRPGRDFELVFLSINPKETPELAIRKKNVYLDLYKQTDTANGWHFLTGDEAQIRRVTDAVGFRYTYDENTDRINHPAGIIIVSPNAVVSSYILGIQYPNRILEDDVARAARNEIGPKAETFLFGCVMVDPVTGQRSIVYKNVIRLAGVLTLIVLIVSILRMSLVGRRAAKRVEAR